MKITAALFLFMTGAAHAQNLTTMIEVVGKAMERRGVLSRFANETRAIDRIYETPIGKEYVNSGSGSIEMMMQMAAKVGWSQDSMRFYIGSLDPLTIARLSEELGASLNLGYLEIFLKYRLDILRLSDVEIVRLSDTGWFNVGVTGRSWRRSKQDIQTVLNLFEQELAELHSLREYGPLTQDQLQNIETVLRRNSILKPRPKYTYSRSALNDARLAMENLSLAAKQELAALLGIGEFFEETRSMSTLMSGKTFVGLMESASSEEEKGRVAASVIRGIYDRLIAYGLKAGYAGEANMTKLKTFSPNERMRFIELVNAVDQQTIDVGFGIQDMDESRVRKEIDAIHQVLKHVKGKEQRL